MKIDGKMLDHGEDIFYDRGFMIAIKAHMPTLLKDYPPVTKAVDPKEAYKYEGDLYSYLTSLGFPRMYHYVIMVANKLLSPLDFTRDFAVLVIPDMSAVNIIKDLYRTTSSA